MMKKAKTVIAFLLILMILAVGCSELHNCAVRPAQPTSVTSSSQIPGEPINLYEVMLAAVTDGDPFMNLNVIDRYVAAERVDADYRRPAQACVTVGDKRFEGNLGELNLYYGECFNFGYSKNGFLTSFKFSVDAQLEGPRASTQEECVALAKGWMEKLFNTGEYEICVSKYYEFCDKMYTEVEFRRYIDDVPTADCATVTFKDGKFYRYRGHGIGSVPPKTELPFDLAATEKAVYAKLDQIYADCRESAFKIVYGEPNFMLRMANDGTLELECEIKAEIWYPAPEPNPKELYSVYSTGYIFVIAQ